MRQFTSSEAEASMNRRGVLKRLGAGTVLSIGGLGIGSQPVLGQTSSTSDNEIEKIDDSISSHDGTTIALSRYEPSADGSKPAIIWIQGGTGARGDADPWARFWAKKGYVVLTFDPRGIGGSGGTFGITPPRSIDDISELIDYLADTDTVQMDGPNDPRLGMEGSSAGSWRSLLTATQDNRVDAISGFIAPYNAANIIARRNVLNWPWTYIVYLGLRAPQVNDASEELLEWTQEAIDTKEPPSELLERFEERSPKSKIPEITAPTMIINSWHDRIIPIRDTFSLYSNLSSAKEKRLILEDFYAHDLSPENRFTTTQQNYVWKTRKHWFAKHLKGIEHPSDSPLQEPPIHSYHAQTDEFETFATLPNGKKSFHLHDGTEGEATHLTLEGDGNSHRAAFDFAIYEQLDLAGVSQLALHITPTGGNPHLFAAVKDVPPESDADPVHLKDQIAALEKTEPGRIEFRMNGVERTINKDHTLRLVLTLNEDKLSGLQGGSGPLFADGLYVDTESPAGLTIHHSKGRESTLEVTTQE